MKYSAVDQNNQIERFELLKDEKIGEGATALVYKVNFKNQTWAAKIFKDDQKINSAKIKAMLEHQPDDLLINLDGQDFIQYAWVKYIIKNGIGKVVGFMMPYVDHDDTYSLDTFYDPVLSKRLKSYESALSLRIQLAINLCELIESLHKNKNYFIDIKPQNIRVYKKNHRVVLLDCDGYSINNPNGLPKRFDAELVSLDYIAPEVKRDNLKPSELGIQQDLYGLAVILFQLLNRGTHPFQGITVDKSITAITNDERAGLGLYAYGLNENWKVKPRLQSIHNLFLDETRALFDRSFETESRTTAQEWIHHFKEILNNKKLELCDKVDKSKKLEKDLVHIKFSGKECIGCKLESEIKTSKPIRKKEYKLNTNSDSTTSGSIKSTSFNTSGYIPNQNKPEEFDFAQFFFWAAIVIFAIFIISLLSNTNESSSSGNSSSYSTASNNSKENCQSIIIKDPKDMCKFYWGNPYSQCLPEIKKELLGKGYRYSPSEICGIPSRNAKDDWTTRTNRLKEMINKNQVKVITAFANGSQVKKELYYSSNNELAPQAIANDFESEMTWWRDNSSIWIFLKNNNIASKVKEISVGLYNSCDSNRYSIGFARFNLDRAINTKEEAILKISYPINGLKIDYNPISCIDIEEVFYEGGNAPQNNSHKEIVSKQNTSLNNQSLNRFAAVYFDKNSTGFGWILGAGSLQEAKSEALKSCISRSPPGADCIFNVGGNYRCIAIAEGIQWRYSYVGNSQSEVKKAVLDECNKNDTCSIPDQGIACEKW